MASHITAFIHSWYRDPITPPIETGGSLGQVRVDKL